MKFSELIAQHLDGALDASSEQAMSDVLDACDETLKPASITIVVKIEPTDIGSYKVYIAEPKLTLPKSAPLPWRAYRDEAGSLSRKHPRQMSIDDIEIKENNNHA